MNYSYLYFAIIFLIGEIVINLTFYDYLKKYFKVGKKSEKNQLAIF
jgi:hypothetical protein